MFVNIAIACSIYDIHIVAKNIVMHLYTGVSLQAYLCHLLTVLVLVSRSMSSSCSFVVY